MARAPKRKLPLTGVLGALLVAPALAACGTTPPPDEEIVAAEVAVGEAEEADAAEHAEGAFTLARDKLARARDAMDDENYTLARRLAEQAEVDAQFAEAETRSEKAKARVADLRESIRALREEIERQRPRTS